ncbi:hypothetical protein [Catenulispora yoronensis]
MKATEPIRLDWLWALVRALLGWTFVWAFLDKLFGLGKATPTSKAWIHGGSPTTAYLTNVKGPFQGFFHGLAGQAWADWLFMIGLAGIGVGLVLGIVMRVTAVCGALLLVFMWMASLPISSNPFLDDHLIDALVVLGIGFTTLGWQFGLGRWWSGTPLVQRYPWLA